MQATRGLIGMLLAFAMLTTGCAAVRADGAAASAVRPVSGERDQAVVLPRAYPGAAEAMVAAYRQTGVRYAVVPPRFEGTVTGFDLGAAVPLKDLAAAVAEATGTAVGEMNGILVFEAPAEAAPPAASGPSKSGPSAQVRAWRLGATYRAEVVPALSAMTDDEDASVRLHALAAMRRMEGDFIRNEWPGRVSIFEVMRDDLDVQALRFALHEGGPAGGKQWQLACELLGRSRDPYLLRALWWPIGDKIGGTLPLALWAVGRTEDSSANWALRKRVKNSFTNWTEDQYLAAISMARVGLASTLRGFAGSSNVDVRRAAVLALGLCPAAPATAARLEASLADPDEAVQFLACQSLARLGTEKSIARLLATAKDATASPVLRCAALEALTVPTAATAHEPIYRAAADADARIRARSADLLGDLGGLRAQNVLMGLIGDEDRWVAASAACALGRLGSRTAVSRVGAYLAGPTADDGRIAAIIGLGRGRSPLAAPPLAKIAADTAQPIRLRRYAVLALAQLADRAGQGAVKSLTAFGTPRFMPFALRHLALETPEKTALYLIPYLARGHRDIHAAAANRLAELGHAVGVRELCEGSNVFDNSARMMHSWGAIRSQGPGALQGLLKAAHNRRRAVRDTAALALGSRIEAPAVDALIRLTADPQASVRSAAAQSLGLTGDPQAVPVLIRLAEEDENVRVYCAAIRALRMRAFIGHPDVRACFIRLAGSKRDGGVVTDDRPSLADQPANSFVLRRWAKDLDDVTMCNVTYESSLTYDSDRKRVVLWGSHGRRADAPQTGQTWFFNTAANTWTRVKDSREWPNGTCLDRGTCYDRANRVVVSPKSGTGGHGWVNGLRSNLQWSVPWVMDGKTDQWYPMRPPSHQGSLGQVPGSFDPRHGVLTWFQGKLWVYDTYGNKWTRHRPKTRPGITAACAFDPRTGRLIAGDPRRTWAFDPTTNTWTDLNPDGPAHRSGASPMVYDPANDIMLSFDVRKGGAMGVWAYHLRENRWEKMPQAYPCPHYGTLDVTFDEARNVAVISGGWQSGRSGEATVRETWTYRYKPVAGGEEPDIGRPRGVAVLTKAGGQATVTWRAPAVGEVVAYRVYRGAARYPWQVTWKRVGNVGSDQLTYTDAAAVAGKPTLTWYRVTAVNKAGEESAASLPGRTAPRAVRWAGAVLGGAGVRLSWAAVKADDVVGYHVYRASVDLGDPWRSRFDVNRKLGDLTRLTKTPVTGTTFDDAKPGIAGPASELTYPKTVAYLVRAVNAWGLEGGPSPVTPALPDAPGPVRVIPWLDGRRLVLWTPGRVPVVRGHHVMRMDDWHKQYVFRWQASPLVGCAFFDDFEFPTADRRRYYVSGVDAIGAVGVPSSGAWSHGFP